MPREPNDLRRCWQEAGAALQKKEKTVDRLIESGALSVIALVKGEERYVFIFRDSQRDEIRKMLGRFAMNRELSFDWYDAATVAHQIRQSVPAKL
jgi:hypothetical protein